MKMTAELINFSKQLTLCNLAMYVSHKENITFEQVLLSIKHTRLYNDIMTLYDPMVCVFPPKAIQKMYAAERAGDMKEYDSWLCNY